MSIASLTLLLSLAAIWGMSFLFTRIAAPVIGPTLLIEARVGLAAVFLAAVALTINNALKTRHHWKHYLFLGVFNTSVPFLLFSFAAQTLPASILSILNATSPIFGAILGALYVRQLPSAKTILGLVLGVAGVALLVGYDKISLHPGAGLAILAALSGSLCFGIATTYARHAKNVNPFNNAHGSLWAATLLLVPALPFFPATNTPSLGVILVVIALGVVCSAIGLLMYFRLVADVGPASALTVTFLIPAFGVLFGHLFLNETVGWYTLVGTLIVITGTMLVTNFDPRRLITAKASTNA